MPRQGASPVRCAERHHSSRGPPRWRRDAARGPSHWARPGKRRGPDERYQAASVADWKNHIGLFALPLTCGFSRIDEMRRLLVIRRQTTGWLQVALGPGDTDASL